MARNAKPTLKDVALLAGCGIATASRVLNDSGPVSVDVRDKVERAARRLGFVFSATGRALQSSRSMTVGCLVPSLVNPVFAEAVQGVQGELAGFGYQLLIASSNYDGAADDEAIRTFLSNGVDGLIATTVAPERSKALPLAGARGVPVSLMFHDSIDGFVTARVDNFEAAREVARQFAAHGHHRTGFLALRFASSDRSRNRYAGFHAECRAIGLADPILMELSEREANAPERLAALLNDYPAQTAIFSSNDFLAIAVQKAARLLGRHVPNDLSVVGFDGIEIGRLLEVPLATIETRPEAIGRQAARTLLTALQGGALVEPPALPFSFRSGATLGHLAVKGRKRGRSAARSSSPASSRTDHPARKRP